MQTDHDNLSMRLTGLFHSSWPWFIVLLILLSLTSISYFFLAATSGYSLGYTEGGVAAATRNLITGAEIYPVIEAPPYVLTNYPPLYFMFAAIAAGFDPGSLMLAGRLLSVACTIGSAAVIAAIVWQVSHLEENKKLRLIYALTGAAFFLLTSPVARNTPMLRVDFMAYFFSLVGVWAFAVGGNKTRWLVISGCAFLAAGFTKPSLISGLATVCILSFLTRPRTGIIFAVLVALSGILIIFLLDWRTNGNFSQHVILSNGEFSYSLEKVLRQLRKLAEHHTAILLLAAFSSISTIYMAGSAAVKNFRERGVKFMPPKHHSDMLLPATFFLVSLFLALAIGRDGASYIYFVELSSATSIMAACAIPWIKRTWQEANSSSELADRKKANAILLTVFLLVFIATINCFGTAKRNILDAYNETRDPVRFHEFHHAVDAFRTADGDVISEDRMIAALSGKRVYLELRDAMRLFEQGRIDKAPVVEGINNGIYPVIILNKDGKDLETIIDPETKLRGSKTQWYEFAEAIANNYDITFDGEYYVVFRPRKSSRAQPADRPQDVES